MWRPGITLGNGRDVGDGRGGRLQQGVDPNQAERQWKPPAQVEGGAGRGRTADTVEQHHLVVAQPYWAVNAATALVMPVNNRTHTAVVIAKAQLAP